MKEITRITTMQITEVLKVNDTLAAGYEENTDKRNEFIKQQMTKKFLADDVQVQTQLFIRDVED